MDKSRVITVTPNDHETLANIKSETGIPLKRLVSDAIKLLRENMDEK